MYQVPDQHGKRVVVTGANSGTGREAARRLAGAGAEVVLAVRTPAKGEAAREEILAAHRSARVEVRRLDLADQGSVREFADGLLAEGKPLDVLVNNAGVMNVPARTETVDGFELQLATNYLGPFALTVRLLPLLLKSPAARVVAMSSGSAIRGRIDLDDLQWRRKYSPTLAYARSKLADLLMTTHLADLAAKKDWPLLAVAAHPGYTRTNLTESGPRLDGGKPGLVEALSYRVLPSQDVERGTEPLLHAVADPDAVACGFYGPRWGFVGPAKLSAMPKAGRDKALAARLWAESERLTGTSVDFVGS